MSQIISGDTLGNRWAEKLLSSWQMLTIDKLFKRMFDVITSKDEAIRLSTIHRAKGLEYDRVFIIEHDKLPWKRPEMQPWEETQEMNLKYVAITRAKKELYLVRSEKTDITQTKGNLFDILPHL